MLDKQPQWYLVEDIDQIDTPALVIYKGRVQHNLALAIEMVGDVSRLRPHVKTHKSPEVTEMMIQAGINKFKCATIAEAEMLGRCGAADVLLAYQPTGPKIGRFIRLMEEFGDTRFSCLVDSMDAAKPLSRAAADHHIVVNVFIDINVGMSRTGVLPEKAMDLVSACLELAGLRIIGLHGYDGHINDTDLHLRKQKADKAFDKLKALLDGIKAAEVSEPVLVIGGSPTFPIHAEREEGECSPGTFIYWDKSYSDGFPDMHFQPAALVLTRVVSVLSKTVFCLDLGHKAVAAENPLERRVHFLNAEGLRPISQSEEHLVIESLTEHRFRVGDVLYGLPFHICPTCALYEAASVVQNGRLIGNWQIIARNRKLSI